MRGPSQEGDVPLDDDRQALAEVGLVTWNARNELWHEISMIESFLLFGVQVRLGARHQSTLQCMKHAALAQPSAVVLDETPRVRAGTARSPRHSQTCPHRPDCSFRKCDNVPSRGGRCRPTESQAPPHLWGELLKAPFIKPVILAQSVRNAVIRPGWEMFPSLPKRRRRQHNDRPTRRSPRSSAAH